MNSDKPPQLTKAILDKVARQLKEDCCVATFTNSEGEECWPMYFQLSEYSNRFFLAWGFTKRELKKREMWYDEI